MAGVTRPMMMNGTKNLMNCPNVSRKQFSDRITQSGANAPIAAPTAIAIASFSSKDLSPFMAIS